MAVLEEDGGAGGAAEDAAGGAEVDDTGAGAEHDAADVADQGRGNGVVGVDGGAVGGVAAPGGRVDTGPG